MYYHLIIYSSLFDEYGVVVLLFICIQMNMDSRFRISIFFHF